MDLNQKNLQEELENITQKIQNNQGSSLIIQGHTDIIGQPDYNQKLSVRRAKSVYEYFINQGFSKTRIKYTGLGHTKPLMDNAFPAGRMINRRVEIFILYSQD